MPMTGLGPHGERAAPADKLAAVGFTGDFPLFAALSDHQVKEPWRFLTFGAGAAGAEEGRRGAQERCISQCGDYEGT